MRKAKSVDKVSTPAPDVITKVVPVPTDGWDAISPLASMDPKRAPILINWIPRPGWVELRKGYTAWGQLGSAAVETIMVRRASGSEQMFAACGSKIYDVSAAGNAPPVAVSGLNSARWQYVNFTPALGTTVIQCVNGVDTLRMFDGTTWTIPAITGLPGGLTTASIINIHSAKRRLWYVLGNGSGGFSTIAAYMPTDAIMGPIDDTIDLGAMWTRGGHLVAITSWTIDGGAGPNDVTVFLSSRGQVTAFTGIDPTTAETWTLAGVFDLSPPISLRCATKLGSDVAIINQQGVIPLSQALPFESGAERSVAITARIQNAMANAAVAGLNLFGWQLISFAPEQLIILNVPQVENQVQVQYVMNALTGAWCQFNGWNANCFEVYNDLLYWGGNDGTVNLAFNGTTDLVSPILADMQCAYNYFDAPGRLKRMTMIQPFISATEAVSPQIAIDVDFQISPSSSPLTIITGGALWDVAIWDQSQWFGSVIQTTNWLSAEAMGHALAIHVTLNFAAAGSALTLGLFDSGVFDSAEFDAGAAVGGLALQINAFNTLLEQGGFV